MKSSVFFHYLLLVISMALLTTAKPALSGTDINRDSRTDLEDVSFVNRVLIQDIDITQLSPDNGSNLKLGIEEAIDTLQALSKPAELPPNSSWILKTKTIQGTLSTNVPDCTENEDEMLFYFTRAGNTFYFTVPDGPEKGTGTIEGSRITFSGSHTQKEDGDTINEFYSGTLTLSSYNELEGEMHVKMTSGPYYCEWDQTVNGNRVVEVIPQFYKSFTHENLTTHFSNTIDVADNGAVYINNHPLRVGTSYPTIEMINSSLTGVETLMHNNDPLYADIMVMDNSQNINLKRYGLFQADNCVYNTLSKSLECSSFFGSGNVYLGAAEDIDSQGNHYMIPESGSGTDADGRHLFIWKVSPDHQLRIASLEKESMLGMFPPSPEADSFILNDIRIAPDGRIFICVDLDGTENSDKDGLLILNSNMEKIQYFGDDWFFNFPCAVDFDSAGNIYVASTYHNQIVILNNQLQQVGCIKWSDILGVQTEENFYPIDLRIKNNKLYIYSGVNNQGALHVFNL